MALLCVGSLTASARIFDFEEINPGSLASVPWEEVSQQLELEKCYGLAIVLPDSGNIASILRACNAIATDQTFATRELLAVPLWFCIDRQALKKVVPDLSIKESVVLLDEKGERITSTLIEWEVGEGADELRKHIFDLKSVLSHWSEASITATGDQATAVRQALKQLDADRSRDRRDARNLLAEFLPGILPALVEQRQTTPSIEVREACKGLIAKCFGREPMIQGHQLGTTDSQDLGGDFQGQIQFDF